MNCEHFYIAELGVGNQNIIKKLPKTLSVFGMEIYGIEVFNTPFDAVRALNSVSKLMPEHHVTIYKSREKYDPTIISNKNSSRSLITTDAEFEKDQVMALGSLVYSL